MAILGLHVGVSFAEFSLLDANTHKPLAYQRTYMPRQPLKSALQKFVQKHIETKIQKIFMVSSHLEKMAPFRLGGSTAHLITEGWENLGWLSQSQCQGLQPMRSPAVQSQELVFGIKERVSAEGQILEAMDVNLISAIAAKMKLMDVKRVCVHFLHSQKNPAHLEQAKIILNENGFEVHHAAYDTDFDLEKSRRLSLSAALNGTWLDFQQDLITAAKSDEHQPEIFVLGQKGFMPLETMKDAVDGLASLDYLFNLLPFQNIVFLGFENFQQIFPKRHELFWNSPWGRVYRPHCAKNVFSTQPTQSLQLNFWNELDLSPSPEGFEPGPVALGRGQKLTVFDLFFDELIQHPELSDWLAPAAGSKIRSGLSALSKNSRNHIGELALQTQLREQFIQRLNLEIDFTDGPVHAIGFWSDLVGTRLPLERHPRSVAETAARLGLGLNV